MKNFFKDHFKFSNFFAFVIFVCIYVYFFNIRDATINETYKNILLIIAGFIFGSSQSSQKKDETINALQKDKPIVGDKVENQTVTIKSGTEDGEDKS